MDIMEFLTVFFAGIIPVNTIKDAVLLGVDVGLNQWVACGAAVLGTLIPSPVFSFCPQCSRQQSKDAEGPGE